MSSMLAADMLILDFKPTEFDAVWLITFGNKLHDTNFYVYSLGRIVCYVFCPNKYCISLFAITLYMYAKIL